MIFKYAQPQPKTKPGDDVTEKIKGLKKLLTSKKNAAKINQNIKAIKDFVFPTGKFTGNLLRRAGKALSTSGNGEQGSHILEGIPPLLRRRYISDPLNVFRSSGIGEQLFNKLPQSKVLETAQQAPDNLDTAKRWAMKFMGFQDPVASSAIAGGRALGGVQTFSPITGPIKEEFSKLSPEEQKRVLSTYAHSGYKFLQSPTGQKELPYLAHEAAIRFPVSALTLPLRGAGESLYSASRMIPWENPIMRSLRGGLGTSGRALTALSRVPNRLGPAATAAWLGIDASQFAKDPKKYLRSFRNIEKNPHLFSRFSRYMEKPVGTALEAPVQLAQALERAPRDIAHSKIVPTYWKGMKRRYWDPGVDRMGHQLQRKVHNVWAPGAQRIGRNVFRQLEKVGPAAQSGIQSWLSGLKQLRARGLGALYK